VDSGSSGPTWGLAEAVLGWLAANLLAAVGLITVLRLGDWTARGASRPGGHIGRTVGQLAADVPLEDRSLPLLGEVIVTVPLWIGMLGVTWLAAGAVGRARPGWRIELRPIDVPRAALAGLLLQIPAIPILYMVIQAVFGEIQPTGRALSLIDRIESPVDVLVLVLFVGVGAPIVEELFYRGLVQRSLVDRFGPAIGIGVTSVLFGAVHFSLVELPALSLAGFVFGWLAWRYERLGPAIVAHTTFNMVTVVALLAAA